MAVFLVKPIIIAFFICLVSTPLVIAIFKKQNWLDTSNNKDHPKHVHKYPIPRGGGISVFLAIIATSLIFLNPDTHLKAILLAAFITLVVGFFDDLFNLNPYLRLATNSIAAIIIIKSGITINFVTNPLGGVINLNQVIGPFIISDIITLIWILWCINVVGWSCGVDGQLPGFVAIASFVIGLLSLKFSQDITQWPVIILAGSVAGAHLGFLPFNFYPQKIMPGYSGKSIAGLFLAILAILSGAKLATLILTLGFPMADGIWAIIRRVSRGKAPVWGDAEHLHHLFLDAGFKKSTIAVVYWLFSAILGALVLNLNSKQKIWAIVMIGAVFAVLVIILKNIIKKKNYSNFSA